MRCVPVLISVPFGLQWTCPVEAVLVLTGSADILVMADWTGMNRAQQDDTLETIVNLYRYKHKYISIPTYLHTHTQYTHTVHTHSTHTHTPTHPHTPGHTHAHKLYAVDLPLCYVDLQSCTVQQGLSIAFNQVQKHRN